ncbi:hypothetical protein RhiJN_26861 [Ceratobasidium sp. AG-Ba]|nr:hypothetical protein RhiJN_26861 [Ceratobasidium sp. AG-Ba]
MICANLHPKAALVSLRFFHAMLPYLWENTSLTCLIERGIIPKILLERRDTREYIKEDTVRENMSRFYIYAPFVKIFRLDILPEYENFDWSALLECSRVADLFPRLQKFECSSFDEEVFRTFLSRSIRRLSISREKIKAPACNDMLGILADKCPKVDQLVFYPSRRFLAFRDPADMFTNLTKLLCVRQFKTSDTILCYIAPLIGKLPSLYSLIIRHERYKHATGAIQAAPLYQSLASDTFASIKHLSIQFGRAADAGSFDWDHLEFRCLTRLSVSVVWGYYGEKDYFRFIPKLCRSRPRLKTIKLSFPECARAPGHHTSIPTEISEQLLNNIDLGHAFDLLRAALSVENAWTRIAAAWSGMKRVSCLYQKATLEELVLLFSELPNLEHLECDLDFKSAVDSIEHTWQPNENTPFYPSLRRLVCKHLDLEEYALNSQDFLNNVARWV